MVAVIMMVAVVFVVPVTFVHVPSVLVVVVVRVAPVGTFIGWTIPASRNPDIAACIDAPIAIDPYEAFSGRRGTALNAQWGRGAADGDTEPDLGGCGNGGGNAGGDGQTSCEDFGFPVFVH